MEALDTLYQCFYPPLMGLVVLWDRFENLEFVCLRTWMELKEWMEVRWNRLKEWMEDR